MVQIKHIFVIRYNVSASIYLQAIIDTMNWQSMRFEL